DGDLEVEREAVALDAAGPRGPGALDREIVRELGEHALGARLDAEAALRGIDAVVGHAVATLPLAGGRREDDEARSARRRGADRGPRTRASAGADGERPGFRAPRGRYGASDARNWGG